jgi:hypothetical protein
VILIKHVVKLAQGSEAAVGDFDPAGGSSAHEDKKHCSAGHVRWQLAPMYRAYSAAHANFTDGSFRITAKTISIPERVAGLWHCIR